MGYDICHDKTLQSLGKVEPDKRKGMGVMYMMWGNYNNMMSGGFIWGSLFGIIILIDLILLGIWLWQQIQKKK